VWAVAVYFLNTLAYSLEVPISAQGNFGFSHQIVNRGAKLVGDVRRELGESLERILEPLEHRIKLRRQAG
jgi:hypothetical protein